MRLTLASRAQHVLVATEKARSWFDYRDTPPLDALSASVTWHLDHAPDDADADFSADDLALESGP